MLQELHEAIYQSQNQKKGHKGDVFYVWVCRCLLGYSLKAVDGNATVDGSPLFAMGGTNKRELANIPGSTAPANALQVLSQKDGGTMRYGAWMRFALPLTGFDHNNPLSPILFYFVRHS
jgi:hypothetical protein